MKSLIMGLIMACCIISDLYAMDPVIAVVYEYTNGIRITRNDKPLLLDYGLEIRKGDVIYLKYKARLYLEWNSTDAELVSMSGQKPKGQRITADEALHTANETMSLGHRLIHEALFSPPKQDTQISVKTLGVYHRGGDGKNEFESTERLLLIQTLMLYIEHNKLKKARQIIDRLKQMRPDSNYLKQVEAYIYHMEKG